MAPSVANLVASSQHQAPSRDFTGVFTAHAGVSFFRVSPDKTSPSKRVSAAEIGSYAFFTPARSVCSALIVDVDRPEAVLEIYESLPAEIHPSWVVETRRGAQAGWFIDPVDLRASARTRPQSYARAVGESLRAALAGDEAVDPLTPVRVRNPTYSHAELRASTTPPVYGLRELHQGLKTAELWQTGQPFTGRSITTTAAARSAAAITKGTRNQTIFDVARYAAYQGKDHAAVAWETNATAAEPLQPREVQGIIRSIDRYMARNGRRGHTRATAAMPDQMRQLLSEMGRRGGQANTPAQQAARARSCRAATAARTRATDARARRAQRMHTRGHTRGHICTKLGASPATLCRWLRRFIRVSLPEHQVVRPPLVLPQSYLADPLCIRRPLADSHRRRPPNGSSQGPP